MTDKKPALNVFCGRARLVEERDSHYNKTRVREKEKGTGARVILNGLKESQLPVKCNLHVGR